MVAENTNPLDFPRYVRSLRPSLPDSLPNYVDDELEKVSQSLSVLEEAASNDAAARVEEERIVRVTEDEALAARIVTVEAEFEAGLAATDARITTEEIARATADEALASSVSSVEAALTSEINTVSGRVTTEELARATADEALGARLTTVEATIVQDQVNTNATIRSEAIVRATDDEALATRIDTVEADYIAGDATNSAAITAEATARASADSAIASDVTTLTTTVSGHTSTLTTHASSISGLEAKYGVTLDVNGYVSGFEQNNGGGTSDFIIRADKFKVVMPGYTGGTPFSVDSSGVLIDGDLIVTGTITSGKIADEAVDTPKIADNAVTIPSTMNSGTTTYGSGSYVTLVSGSVTLDEAGTIFALFTGSQAYSSGLKSWGLRIKINGTVVSSVGGSGGYTDAVSCSGSTSLSAGTYTVLVEWQGQDSTLSISNDTTYTQGVQK